MQHEHERVWIELIQIHVSIWSSRHFISKRYEIDGTQLKSSLAVQRMESLNILDRATQDLVANLHSPQTLNKGTSRNFDVGYFI